MVNHQRIRLVEVMKEIKAIIRPSKLLEVAEELHEIDGLPGVTVSEIRGFGKGRAKNKCKKSNQENYS